MHAPQGPLGGTPRPTAERSGESRTAGTAGTAGTTGTTGTTGADGRLPPPRLTLRHGAAARSAARPEAPRRLSAAPDVPEPADEGGEVDWRAVGLFGAGVALGALLGAGAALLMAPASGFETRMRLARGARRARHQAADRWESLEDRARHAARQGKRRLARRLTMARWRAQDAWERKRYGDA
ncbi:Uncharacterized protein family YtxH [Gemmatirosa kalamazoonensis]|uniref:Uncharacterized protein family YtxH n=1 Tax=Gemmatirosa kalamazoonensis TaxID=861299 RepID=W0RGP1_9BACT|nr:YtxH domain-containing protein [Gemmatirosa kalamazoonensis]AHG90254.1 Uncharacterized protein family YtxH [Gemmatirosa kalamazoonensis]